MEKFPLTNHGIISRGFGGIFSYCGWPSVCATDSGELLAVCSGYRIAHICPFGKTVMFRSPDGGETWSTPIIINDSLLDDRDAGILSLGGGKLLVTWFAHPPEAYLEKHSYWPTRSNPLEESMIALAQISSWRSLVGDKSLYGSFVILSDNNGLTWSEKIKVPVSAPHGPALLSNGSLLYFGKGMYDETEGKGVAAYKSNDSGKSWQRLSGVHFPEGTVSDNFHEPHALELPDGRILGAIRAQGENIYKGFTIYTCFSDDCGGSWSVPECLNVSGSPPHLMLHSSGAVICTFGRREKPFGERALVSYDNGRTWPDEYVIRSDAPTHDLGYPASVELPDGKILTVYYQQYGSDVKTSLLYTVWEL